MLREASDGRKCQPDCPIGRVVRCLALGRTDTTTALSAPNAADEPEARSFTRDGTIAAWRPTMEPLRPGSLTYLRGCPSGDLVAAEP
jgi:hypothetical protein